MKQDFCLSLPRDYIYFSMKQRLTLQIKIKTFSNIIFNTHECQSKMQQYKNQQNMNFITLEKH